MKRLFLLSLLISLTFYSLAQTSESPSYIYAQIVGEAAAGYATHNMDVTIDYGINSKLIVDKGKNTKNGIMTTHTSMIDALNQMSAEGWEYVNTSALSNKVYFIIRKKQP